MLIPSSKTYKKMVGAHVGIWPEVVNDGADIELAVKLTTDMAKALLKGAKLSFVVSVVHVGTKSVRIIGLILKDRVDDPAWANQPQSDAKEIEFFELLLKKRRIWLTVFDELVRPVLDGILVLDESQTSRAIQELESSKPHYAGTITSILQSAMDISLDIFQRWRKGESYAEFGSWQVISAEVRQLKPLNVFSTEAGKFSIDDRDEGGGLEKSIHLLMEANFTGFSHINPYFLKGNVKKEFCDVFVTTGQELFIFQSKVMPVLLRTNEQTNERRAATVLNNFRDALGQLRGSVRKLRLGNRIFNKAGTEISVNLDQIKVIHGVVVLSTTNLPLPWEIVARELHAEGKDVSAKFHVLDFIELQQHVAFGKTPEMLSSFLDRRSDVVSKSQSANIMVHYRRHESTPLESKPIRGKARGYVFTFEVKPNWDRNFGAVIKLFLQIIREEQFTGRCEYYQELGRIEGEAFLWIALGCQWSEGKKKIPDYEWWKQFEKKIKSAVESQTDLILSPLSEMACLEEIRTSQKLAFVIEFVQGNAVKFFDPDAEQLEDS